MASDNVIPGTTTLEALLSSGWEEDDEVDEELSRAWHDGLGTADGLMNTANEFPRSWEHEKVWTDDQGRKRLPSQAVYGNIVNGKDGYIIAGGNFAAWTIKARDVETWMYPDTKWSDIMAVQWNQHAAGGDLKRVYRSNVIYDESKALMESAMEKIGKSGDLDDLPLWPGVDFTPGKNPTKMPMQPATEAFMGLLGSSHAAGVAYLFIQYRAIFTKKRINKIKLFKDPSKPAGNMLIYIKS